MSRLEIHVLTEKYRDGEYASHTLVTAQDPDPMVRASMVQSGAHAAAMMVSGHTRAISTDRQTDFLLDQPNRRLIGE